MLWWKVLSCLATTDQTTLSSSSSNAALGWEFSPLSHNHNVSFFIELFLTNTKWNSESPPVLWRRATHPNFSCVTVCHNSFSSVCLLFRTVKILWSPCSYFAQHFTVNRPRFWHGRADGIAVCRLRGAADSQLVQEQLFCNGGAAGNVAGCHCLQL